MTEIKLDQQLLNEINSQYEMKDVKIKVNINGEVKDATISIYDKFPSTNVGRCIEEFIDKMSTVMRKNRGHFTGIYEPYLMFMIIKHFSSFPAPELYEEQAKVIKMMIDNDLLFEIFSKFNEDEVEKVFLTVDRVSKDMNENMEEYARYLTEHNIEEAILKQREELSKSE